MTAATPPRLRTIDLGDDDRVYFLHVPKTAGTSVAAYVASRFPPEQVCPAQTWPELLALSDQELANYRLFSGHHFWFENKLPRSPHVITVVRDPVARSVSEFGHVARTPESYLHEAVNAEGMSLLDSVTDARGRKHLWNVQTRHLAANAVEVAQDGSDLWPRFFAMEPEELLALAQQVVDRAVVAGTVEHLTSTLNLVAYTFGWPPPVPPRLNVSPVRAEPSQAVVEALAGLVELDRRLHAYADRRLHEALVDLERAAVQARHDARRRDREETARLPLTVDLGEPVPGSGWWMAETVDDVTFRWTGPGSDATLDLPVPRDRDLTVRFVAFRLADIDAAHEVQLLVNGDRVPLSVQVHRPEAVYTARVPLHVLRLEQRPFTRFTIHVPDPVEPGPDAADGRTLGLAVRTFTVDVAPAG